MCNIPRLPTNSPPSSSPHRNKNACVCEPVMIIHTYLYVADVAESRHCWHNINAFFSPYLQFLFLYLQGSPTTLPPSRYFALSPRVGGRDFSFYGCTRDHVIGASSRHCPRWRIPHCFSSIFAINFTIASFVNLGCFSFSKVLALSYF